MSQAKALFKITEHDGWEFRTHYVFGEDKAFQTLVNLVEKEESRKYRSIPTMQLVNTKEVKRVDVWSFEITSPQDRNYIAELWMEPVRCIHCLTELTTENIHSLQEVAKCITEAFCVECANQEE